LLGSLQRCGKVAAGENLYDIIPDAQARLCSYSKASPTVAENRIDEAGGRHS
jgi:hypothetical protein